MKDSKIELWLPEELIGILDKYSLSCKDSKEDILRKALYEFFRNHPIEEWSKTNFEEMRKNIREDGRDKK